MGEECGPCAPAMPATAEPGTGGPPGCGLARGRRQPAPAPPHRKCLGVAGVVCGRTAVESLHGERVPEPPGHPFGGTQGGQPRPGAEACDPDAKSRPRGCEGLEQGGWACWQIPRSQHRAIAVEETAGHGPSVPVDPTRKWVLLGVKSPEVSSSSWVCSLLPAYHWRMWRGDLNKYQGPGADALQRPLVPRSRFQAQLRPGVMSQEYEHRYSYTRNLSDSHARTQNSVRTSRAHRTLRISGNRTECA